MVMGVSSLLLPPSPPGLFQKSSAFSGIKKNPPHLAPLQCLNLRTHKETPSRLSSLFSLWPNILSISIFAATLTFSPQDSLAIPFLSNPQASSSVVNPPSTPFSQSKNLPIGLENGKIRPCPSVNPGCISTNPQSTSFTFPWRIPETSLENAIQQLQNAITKTQKNVNIQVVEDMPNGKYLQAEVDGGFGRDVLEFLVKDDTVAYRAMATKVTYVYPFTTAFGDSKGQEERMKKIMEELGWYAPSFESMD